MSKSENGLLIEENQREWIDQHVARLSRYHLRTVNRIREGHKYVIVSWGKHDTAYLPATTVYEYFLSLLSIVFWEFSTYESAYEWARGYEVTVQEYGEAIDAFDTALAEQEALGRGLVAESIREKRADLINRRDTMAESIREAKRHYSLAQIAVRTLDPIAALVLLDARSSD